jgi:hypothetical protein
MFRKNERREAAFFIAVFLRGELGATIYRPIHCDPVCEADGVIATGGASLQPRSLASLV